MFYAQSTSTVITGRERGGGGGGEREREREKERERERANAKPAKQNKVSELRSCVRVEVAILGSLS